jgi:hypothetical protein
VDFTKPPKGYVASLGKQILPGSLNITSGAQQNAGTVDAVSLNC